jgi:hypothetical protein
VVPADRFLVFRQAVETKWEQLFSDYPPLDESAEEEGAA